MEFAREEGKALGRKAIETLCQVLDISVDEARRHQLDQADAAALNTLLDHLRAHRRWPDS
jgi:hypothetical protein